MQFWWVEDIMCIITVAFSNDCFTRGSEKTKQNWFFCFNMGCRYVCILGLKFWICESKLCYGNWKVFHKPLQLYFIVAAWNLFDRNRNCPKMAINYSCKFRSFKIRYVNNFSWHILRINYLVEWFIHTTCCSLLYNTIYVAAWPHLGARIQHNS